MLSTAVVALTLVCSVWIYSEGSSAFGRIAGQSANTAQVAASVFAGQLQQLALRLTAATAIGGVVLALVLGVGLTWWRRLWIRRVSRQSQTWEENASRLAQATDLTEQQRTLIVKLEEDLRKIQTTAEQRLTEKTATLAKTCATLQEELNERKLAERAMAQQTTELVRSKDVLEMHVQARTQELQKLQRQYESILNSAGEGIYGLDLQGRTTFVNPAAAKLTGWTVAELVGKSEREIFQQPVKTSDTTTLSAVNDANVHHLAERSFVRADGTTFMVEYIRTPIEDRGRMTGAVVIFKDITERKRTEEALNRKAAELARSNSELEQFAYVASHDLQEPLRKIQAFGDRLKTKCDAVNLQEGRDYLERMQSAAARMQTLINDLLTFSRVISNTQPFVPVDLGVVTREVLGDLEVSIEKSKAQVEVGELPTIDADPMQMRQLLQNLIGNALKFQSPEATPVVKIRAQIQKNPLGGGNEQLPEEICELSIEDNGIGFEEKYVEKIFAVFQRLHGRTEYKGTGVGLAVCRRITDRHGGTIRAQSELGKGATFIVSLPVSHPKKKEACE